MALGSWFVLHRRQCGPCERRRPGTRRSTETVLIIGASSGIGKALALQYAQRGATLFLVARRQEQLERVADQCRACLKKETEPSVGYGVFTLVADITQMEDLVELEKFLGRQLRGTPESEHTAGEGGSLDTLVLCAGVLSVRPFAELAYGETSSSLTQLSQEYPFFENENTLRTQLSRVNSVTQSIFATNVYGLIHATQLTLPWLSRAPAGRIVVVSSAAGCTGTPTRTLYAASKHALHGFFDSLRIELAYTSRVTVCLVCPGTVATDLRRSAADLVVNPSVSSATSSSNSEATVTGSTQGKLSAEACAQRILDAADNLWERTVFIPRWYGWIPWLQFVHPTWLDYLAAKKYGLVK
ncbi:hypothetical protein IWQ62_003153 [Dispira parvispora]|uniref:Ketoreductase domain-containing protein n=1 Tax=Dispira parvispora TaxID=1520584 RepID=A0A9W8ARE5_9FUNG|nr:hypothetical protein IWQ62_003153 [Dispira parvispora]